MSKTAQMIIVAGVLVIFGVAACAVIGLISQNNPLQPVADGVGGVATSVAEVIPQATPTIYPSSATIIRSVQSLARLETASYSIEKVIVAEENQDAFASLFGDRLLLVAHGDVIAGIDLSKMATEDVRTVDGRVYITIPASELFIVALDNDKTYVYDREIGFLTQGDYNLETAARQAAEDEIEKAALEDGILRLAQQNGEQYLQTLMLGLGFEEVIFLQATATP